MIVDVQPGSKCASVKGVVKWKTKTWETFTNLGNFVHWPYISQKCDLAKPPIDSCPGSTSQESFEYISKTSWNCVTKNSLTW